MPWTRKITRRGIWEDLQKGLSIMKTLMIIFERIFHFMCMNFFVLDVCVCIFLSWMYVWMPPSLFALPRLHRDHGIPWTWSYRELLSALWRLGIDTTPSLRVACVLNHKLSPPYCLSINMTSIFLLWSNSFSSHIAVCFLEMSLECYFIFLKLYFQYFFTQSNWDNEKWMRPETHQLCSQQTANMSHEMFLHGPARWFLFSPGTQDMFGSHTIFFS